MYLVSTGKTTVLSEFSNLDKKSVYKHTNGETTDFQFYARQRIFLEVNKKSGLEIMRIKEKDDHGLEIQRVRKLNIENVYCVACAKQSLEEMAFGGINGQVSLYNYKNAQFLHRFKSENKRNSVLYVDYNGTDEYIASVFESGQINVYGTKTKTKVDDINIDGNSTLARFHPAKRFQLSIASLKGAVTIYDLQTKRKIFNLSEAHTSPCRDLCMSAVTPDTLISVGYDCIVNIFDTRRRSQQIKLSHSHPLSTAAMSSCGTYFCIGNLKGELISYDMRNLKTCLNTKKVHDCSITRLSFVPLSQDDCSATASFIVNAANNTENASEKRKSMANARQRDSFCDFLDFQVNKLDNKSTRFTMRRDSFDWDTLGRKPTSMEDNQPSLTNLNTSIENTNNSGNLSNDSFLKEKLNMSFEYVNTRRGKAGDESKRQLTALPTAPLREVNNASKMGTNLMQIVEEESGLMFQQPDISSDSDKENAAKYDEQSDGDEPRLSINAYNSTPNRGHTDPSIAKLFNPPEINKLVESKELKVETYTEPHPTNILQQIIDLRSEMNTRFKNLESELKFNAEQNKWQIFTQTADIWARQMNTTEDIRDALNYLLQSDPFVNEFFRLKEENEALKAQLQQFMEK